MQHLRTILLSPMLFISVFVCVFVVTADYTTPPTGGGSVPGSTSSSGGSYTTSGTTSSSTPVCGDAGVTTDALTGSPCVTTSTGLSSTYTGSSSSSSSSSSGSSSSASCTPTKLGSAYVNLATGEIVDAQCKPVGASTASSSGSSSASSGSTTSTGYSTDTVPVTSSTSTSSTTPIVTPTVTPTPLIGSSPTASGNTATSITSVPTSVSPSTSTRSLVPSVADTIPVTPIPKTVEKSTESTATISNSGAIDVTEKLADVGLKEKLIEGYFTINNSTIAIDPENDSMQSIVDRINASKARVSAAYNVNLDRVQIESTDVDTIIKLGNWKDTSNFLGVINLLPTKDINTQIFDDVPLDRWSARFVNNLSAMKIVIGKTEKLYGIHDNITRIEALKIIMESLKMPVNTPRIIEGSSGIQDVDKSYWGYKYVSSAMNLGIVPKADIFHPDEPMTRGEMLEWMMRAKGISVDTTATTTFTDIEKSSSRYYGYIATAQRKGIVSGYEDGTFGEANPITREEFAKIVFNVLATK